METRIAGHKIYAVAFVLWVGGLALGVGAEGGAELAKFGGAALSMICFIALDYMTLFSGSGEKE